MDLPVLASGTRLCTYKELADGRARVIPLHRGWPIVEVIVVRRGDVCFAYHNQCAHQPVPLSLRDDLVYVEGDSLVCDHHYATFRIADGYCEVGPCTGDSLASVALSIREGVVFIA